MAQLTDLDAETLDLIARGMTNREIAKHLGLSMRTIDGRVEKILRLLGARNRTEAAIWWTAHRED